MTHSITDKDHVVLLTLSQAANPFRWMPACDISRQMPRMLKMPSIHYNLRKLVHDKLAEKEGHRYRITEKGESLVEKAKKRNK